MRSSPEVFCPLSPRRNPRMPVLFRCLSLTALLVLEIFFLTIRFDTRRLDFEPRWWAAWMGEVYWLPRFAIAMAGALLLLAGKVLWDALLRLAPELQPLRRAGPFLIAHLFICAAFTQVSALIFDTDTRVAPAAGLWVVAWWVLGFLCVALLFLTAFPFEVWARCLWRGRSVLAAATAVGLAACAFGWATDFFWRPLAQGTLWIVQGLLGFLPVEVVSNTGDLEVGTASFAVVIGPACSGYEGIGLFWVFIGVYLWLFRKTLCFPQAFLLIAFGTALMWCCNVLRILGLIALGTWGSAAVALGGFHSQVGWLAFNVVALGLVAGSQRLRFFAKVAREPSPPTQAAVYLAPFTAVLATGMITAAFTAGFDYCYPLRLIVGGAILYHYRRSYTGLLVTWSWTAVAIGAGVFVLWIGLDQLQAQTGLKSTYPASLALMGRSWATAWLVLRLFGYVLLTPLVEELAFRGYLISRIIGDKAQEIGQVTWLSFLLSSLLFGLFHQSHWLAASLAGMAYALALFRRRQLMDAVLAHATTNAMIASYVLITERWSVWG
jgi:exosortase E/protease (VPEID-CTERM system)